MHRSARIVTLLAVSSVALTACGGPDPVAPSAVATADVGPVHVALRIVAENIEFSPPELTAPAGVGLAVTFDHRDADIPHNLVLVADVATAPTLAETEIVNGPATQVLEVPGLIPGAYRFSCVVHPNITARLTVQP